MSSSVSNDLEVIFDSLYASKAIVVKGHYPARMMYAMQRMLIHRLGS